MERRTACELRAGGSKNAPRLHGYAARFSPAISDDLGGWREQIQRGAFERTLADNEADPLALYAHQNHLILGRRSAGTLRLHEDNLGLAFELDLPDTTLGRDLFVSVSRGDIRQMSFSFTVDKNGDGWEVRGGQVIRTLKSVALHEVSLCAHPAYPDTTVAKRAFESRKVPREHLRRAMLWLETL